MRVRCARSRLFKMQQGTCDAYVALLPWGSALGESTQAHVLLTGVLMA